MNTPLGEPRFPEPMDPLPPGTRPPPRRFQYSFGAPQLSDPDEMLENPSSPNTPATDQASTGVNENPEGEDLDGP